MFSELKFKGVMWLKNNTKEGGAQNEILKGLTSENNIIHLHNKNLGRLWGLITEDQILKLIKKNIGLYEVISKYPYKVHFDIDGDNLTDLNEHKKKILEHFPKALMAVSGYENDEKKSYHIVLSNYIIQNEKEREQLKILVKSMGLNFDWKIYTNNRNMKAINQSKIRAPIQKIIEDKDPKNHLITFYIPNQYEKLEIKLSEEQIIKENHKLNLSELPKLKLTIPENIDLTDPKELLKITPLTKDHPHAYTHKIARFCFYNDLTFNDFIEWYKNKSDNKFSFTKWFNHWEKLDNFPPFSIKQLLNILEFYYPNISENSKVLNFINQFNINKTPKFINSLSIKDFETDKKGIIFNIGMGGGKTTQTINYLKDKNFCWITPNISLASNTFTRLKENKIKVHYYDDSKNKKDKAEKIAQADNLIICLNSLKYITKNYDVLVIDEIETFLLKWIDNKTLDSVLDICWKNFITLIKNSKKLILLDAFISKLTTDFLDDLKIDYEIVKRNKEQNPRKAVIVPNFNYFFNDLVKNISKDKKCLIFYPYKKGNSKYPSMYELEKEIENRTNKKGISHNADSNDKINKKLFDVNKNWKNYDFVISNNKINVGLNFDLDHFDLVYLSMSSFNLPRDIIQFSYRTRNLKDNLIKYCYLDCFNSKKDFLIQNVKNNNDIFQNLSKNIIIERTSPIKKSFEFFLSLAKYEIENKKLYEDLNQEVKFESENYYDFYKIPEYDPSVIKDLEILFYSKKLDMEDKLVLKKHYFLNQFKKQTKGEHLSFLWNNNIFDFIKKVREVLTKETIIKKLKDNYNWSLIFPQNIEKDFKLTGEDLIEIFKIVKFKNLTEKSNHRLILSRFINTFYDENIIISKCKNKNYSFKVNDKFLTAYIILEKSLKLNYEVEFI